MGIDRILTTATILTIVTLCALASSGKSQQFAPFILPEERTVCVRDPCELAPVAIPATPAPPTITSQQELPARHLSLDEAIGIALANAETIRVLGGVSAVSSGRTVYDAAIVHKGIDQQNAVFDPVLSVQNGFYQSETPGIFFDPTLPNPPVIEGVRQNDYRMDFDLSKKTILGGTLNFGVTTNSSQDRPVTSILDPQSRASTEVSYTQPLLQGGGIDANRAGIVLARIETERSFFQFKDGVQELLRGVIQAYWDLVFARTDHWARQQQLDQLQEAYERAEKQSRLGIISGVVADQARVAMLNAKSTVLRSRSSMLDREAALRSILGLPPYGTDELVPTTPPALDRIDFDWPMLLELAGQQRPDVIELKLVLEADEQQLLLANNNALPRLDAVALYRWNGMEGEVPPGVTIASRPGQFTDWTMAVNFSVPLGLRAERAALRRWELILARDHATLEQRLLEVSHTLAAAMRNLDLAYIQYETHHATREAAKTNLEAQLAAFRNDRVIFLNVLQAVTDWGNAVSNEAQTLLDYNQQLASLERQTGTILESHGVRFSEERYGSIAPLGRLHMPQCYPYAIRPTQNEECYPQGDRPAESSFDLQVPNR